MSSEFIDSFLNAVIGIEIAFTKLTGKWTVSQNRTTFDKLGTVIGLQTVDNADVEKNGVASGEVRAGLVPWLAFTCDGKLSRILHPSILLFPASPQHYIPYHQTCRWFR